MNGSQKVVAKVNRPPVKPNSGKTRPGTPSAPPHAERPDSLLCAPSGFLPEHAREPETLFSPSSSPPPRMRKSLSLKIASLPLRARKSTPSHHFVHRSQPVQH